MSSLAQVAASLQQVLTEVPLALARSSGYCRRRSKLTAVGFVQTVVLGWLAQPTGSLHGLTQVAAALGVGVTPQALAQRFGPAAARLLEGVLAAAVAQVVTGEAVARGLVARFPAVVLLDSTTVGLPVGLAAVWAGCGGRVATGTHAALKLTVRLDLCQGRLEGPLLSPGRMQDKSSPLQQAAIPPGAVRIGDLGYWSLAVLAQIRAAGGHFLSRLHVQSVVCDAAGTRLDLGAWLRCHPDDEGDVAVTVGQTERLPARLLVRRVPVAVAAARRRAIRKDAKREGETPSARKLELADWTLLVTSLPADQLTVAEAFVLARARWQIELLFKLWKDQGGLDAWRSADPWRVLCEVYAKLIALVIQHWILLTGCWVRSDRSLTRAAATVRAHGICLTLTLSDRTCLVDALAAIHRCLAAGCRTTKRRGRPSLAQLLDHPDLGYPPPEVLA